MGSKIGSLGESRTVYLQDLDGQVVAVDAYIELYQYLTAITDDWNDYIRNDDGFPISHIIGLVSRNAAVLDHGVSPVYVFDGGFPELKTEELEKRKHEGAEEAFWEAKANGNRKRAKKLAYKKVGVTDAMVDSAITVLNAMGIPSVRAPCEGESQCAQLVHEGTADHVVTNDHDTLCYGVPTMIKDWNASGAKRLDLETILESQDWTLEELRWYAVLRGTDYNSSPKGVGKHRGRKIINESESFDEVMDRAESWDDVNRSRWMRVLELFDEPEVHRGVCLEWPECDLDALHDIAHGQYGMSERQLQSYTKRLE